MRAIPALALTAAILFPTTRDLVAQELWQRADSVSQNVRSWERVQRDHDSTLDEVIFVRLTPSAFHRAADEGSEVELDLPDQRVGVHLSRLRPQLEYSIFRGESDQFDGAIVFAVGPAGDTAGKIALGSRHYLLRYTGDSDVHAVFGVNEAASHAHEPCGTTHDHAVFAPRNEEDERLAATSPDGGTPTLIDVCTFWTPGAVAASGGSLKSTVAAAVATASLSGQISGVDHELRLVYAGLTNYAETGTSTDLSRFRSTSDGFMDEVHQIRSNYGGDLMTLIIGNSNSFCGVGYLMSSNSTGFRSSAFSVTVFGCIGNDTLSHEMGHTMGCAHDRQNAGGALFSYSYGYRTPGNQYRTIMSYSPGQRVSVWSSPNVTYQGFAMGTPTEDNARSLDTVKTTIAAFYTQTAYHWRNVGGGIFRPGGKPLLVGAGTNNGAETPALTISSTLPGAPGVLLIGASATFTPILGGVLVPNPLVSIPITGSFFAQTINLSGMETLPPPVQLYWQAWFADAGGPLGFTASDGLCVDAI